MPETAALTADLWAASGERWYEPNGGTKWDCDNDRTATVALAVTPTGAHLHPVMGIVIRGHRYKATRPVALNVERRGEQYFAENSTFNVCGYGPTAQVAVESAVEHLAYYFQRYTSLADDRLTEAALEIKRRYLDLFIAE